MQLEVVGDANSMSSWGAGTTSEREFDFSRLFFLYGYATQWLAQLAGAVEYNDWFSAEG